ncbi:MAG TPA: glycosyltransferase family 4 protein [Candidatus Polarisedimenticolia bacterium]
MKPIRIFCVAGDDARLRLPLILDLRRRGFDVTAVGSDDPRPFVESNVPYHRYSLTRDLRPMSDARSFSHLLRLFKEQRPDVVHAFATKPALLAPIAARRAGVPCVVRTIAGMGSVFSSQSLPYLALRPLYRLLQRRASEASTVTVFQNEEDLEYFRRNDLVPRGRERLVRSSGIDPATLAAAVPGRDDLTRLRESLGLNGHLVVTMVSRLLKHKGVREFISAARQVRSVMPGTAFLLVGPAHPEGFKGVSVAEVEASSADVTYLGPRGDVPALLAMSDLVVLPSYYREGVPRVLLEAGALGLPLITTDMPGCREVVRDAWNGLLVPPRDASALAAAIRRLLSNRDERLSMGRRNREHVPEQFSLERVAGAHAEIYRTALGRV